MIIIYGLPDCENCDEVRKICTKLGLTYEYNTLGVDITFDQLNRITGRMNYSVPQVFNYLDGFMENIGGFDEFKRRFVKDSN